MKDDIHENSTILKMAMANLTKFDLTIKFIPKNGRNSNIYFTFKGFVSYIKVNNLKLLKKSHSKLSKTERRAKELKLARPSGDRKTTRLRPCWAPTESSRNYTRSTEKCHFKMTVKHDTNHMTHSTKTHKSLCTRLISPDLRIT